MAKKFEVNLLNKRTGYDPELMKEMFLVFKEKYQEYFSLMLARSQSKDWVGVSEIAHRAKSSVAIMGMESIREAFNEIETVTYNGSEIPDFEPRLNQLQNDVELAVLQIEAYIREFD
ncbi:MAG: Hpt domain-containing protein [Bacteroidales bacterium]|jgi:HPt (histidine-containing phosphotransfer) domain-containing protein|nr:Hpt domain-containing protein [Bacteroidales bacterium]